MNKVLNNYFKTTDALLISSRPNIVYLTDYSGFSQTERECFLLITKSKKYIITDDRYSEAIKKQIPDFTLINIGAPRFVSEGEKNIKDLINLTVGVEENDLTVLEYKSLKKITKKLVNIDLSHLRIVKDTKEIKNIRLACSIADKAFFNILNELKTGVTEKEIASKINAFFKEKGDGISFNPTVAFGANSSIPHHVSSKTKLVNNSIVLFDFGAWVNNYCSDISRTIFFGKAPEKFKKMHSVVLEAQKKSIDAIKPGVLAKEIDRIARNYIVSKGYPNILHSVGHGIGIEVHESPTLSPNSKDIIKNGMVFSVEPGIYIPGFGGVRIEDLVLVREGYAQLISNARREIIELHA